MERLIGLIDMDCFYVQVEQRERPELWDLPVVVVQHAGGGMAGGILAVSYEARPYGVKRGMMVSEAMLKCPDLNVCFVPQGEYADKADIQKYRDASAEVFEVLNNVDERMIVEKASVDEAFLDMTEVIDQMLLDVGADVLLLKVLENVPSSFPTTHLADGNDQIEAVDNKAYDREKSIKQWLDIYCRNDINHLRLALSAELVEQIRAAIFKKTHFFCSGGIANNKMLAKLVCGRHKPRQQTVLPFELVDTVFPNTPIGDVRMMGGKLGNSIQQLLGVKTMGDLATVDFSTLALHFGGQAQWISQVARGIDDEPVKSRNSQSSIAVSKNFPGKNALVRIEDVRKWLDGLSKELSKRLILDQIKNKRTAENVVFGMVSETNTSKTLKINSYNPSVLFCILWSVAKGFNKAPTGSDRWEPAVQNIYMSASHFVDGVGQSKSIMEWIDKRIQKIETSENRLDEIAETHEDALSFLEKAVDKKSAEEKKVNHEEMSGSSLSYVKTESNAILSYKLGEKSADKSEPEVKLDADGWQIWDPSLFENVPISTTCNEYDPEVAKEVLRELPNSLKAELSHYQNLEDARKLKATVINGKEKEKNIRKRSSKTNIPKNPPKKPIESFFKKSG